MNDPSDRKSETGQRTSLPLASRVAGPESNHVHSATAAVGRPAPRPASVHFNGEKELPRDDIFWFADVVLRRWHWLILTGCALAGVALWLGSRLWAPVYTTSAQVVRYDSPNALIIGGAQTVSAQTFATLFRSQDLLQSVSTQAVPRIEPQKLARSVRVVPERDSEVITINVVGTDSDSIVRLANLYAAEAVRLTQRMQAHAAEEVSRFTSQQLGHVQAEIAALRRPDNSRPTMPGMSPAFAAAPSPALLRLQAARDELANLLAQYTEAHPAVRAQRARLEAFESQFKTPATPAATGTELSPTGRVPLANGEPLPASSSTNLTGGPNEPPSMAFPGTESMTLVAGQLQSLEAGRLSLLERQNAARAFVQEPPGYYRLLTPATPDAVTEEKPALKIVALAVFAGILGVLGAGALLLFVEAMDDRLKTSADLHRVTRLPVIATGGNFRKMSEMERRKWAFRTWTSLQHRLDRTPERGLVCGFTSATHSEEVSVANWARLLGDAALHHGSRVLSITTRPLSSQHKSREEISVVKGERTSGPFTLDANLLASPSSVTERLTTTDQQILLHLPLPGWVWSLENRRLWEAAIDEWSLIENIVILIELPPAGEPEAVLLAEGLPNLVWLADSGKAPASESRERVDALRHPGCHLVGAVLGQAPHSFLQRRFKRWVSTIIAGCGLLQALPALAADDAPPPPTPAPAQETQVNPARPFRIPPAPEPPVAPIDPPPEPTPAAATEPAEERAAEPAAPPAENALTPTGPQSLSVTSPRQRTPWLERLTLGPGDVLNLSFFGQPALTRQSVPVGPDGRISYLEAQDVVALGKTIDELREAIDEELGKFRRAPRTMISPVEFRSKKYFVLGGVVDKGVFTLDRPMTVIEAIARARGLETTLSDRTTVDLADLSRSFVARQGKRLPVNFEKLFQSGDLSQNVALAPNDYIFIPVGHLAEIYVLGEVSFPGIVTYNSGMSSIGAISVRGGFTPRAWRKRILIVRGSLDKPQTFVVDITDVVNARAPDFQLEPRDIIYVAARPWIRAEELLEAATSSFVQAIVITWAGEKIMLQ